MKAVRVAAVAAACLLTSLFAPLQLRGIAQQASSQEPAAITTGVREAAWSPDGKRIAATWYDAIWTMGPEGKDPKRLVAAPQGWAAERDAAWSPDGKSIAFSASTNGEFDLWIAPSNGGTPRKLTSAAGDERWPSWTPNGQIVYSQRPPKSTWRLVVMPADGRGEAAVLTQGNVGEWQARVS